MIAKVIDNTNLKDLLKLGDKLEVQNVFFTNDGNYLRVPCNNRYGYTWALLECFELSQ